MTPTIMSKFKRLVNFALWSIVIRQEILQIWGELGLVMVHGSVFECTFSETGVSNRWNGIWNGMVERKMKWNGECT